MSYKLGLYEKSMSNSLSLREKLTETARAGYDYLEISIDESDEKLARLNLTRQETADLAHACRDTNIPIKSMCLSGHRRYPLGSRNKDTREKSLEIMGKAVELAASLGIPIIQLAGYDVYYEKGDRDTENYFCQGLEKSVEMAAKEGIILAFETMETPFMDTVEKALNRIDSYPSPYLQIYPDIGNITNAALLYNQDPIEDLKKGYGHIAAVHLKESKPGVYRELPYGRGHVNFKGMIKASLEMGVRLFVAEFWYMGENNWREILINNKDFLEKCIRVC